MAGKIKKKVFVYTKFGYFIQEFESQLDFLKFYYDNNNRGLVFKYSQKFETIDNILETIRYGIFDEFFAFEKRMNRKDILFLQEIHNSEFCKKIDLRKKEIEVFNLCGEKIAEFKSLRLLSKMLPHIPISTIWGHLNEKNKGIKRFTTDCELFFKYKKT